MRAASRLLAAALAVSAAAWMAPPALADDAIAAKPWKLLIFHAFRPRVLGLCERAHLWENFEVLAMPDPADPQKSRWLDEAAEFRWPGGSTRQAGRAYTAQEVLTDACFTLFVDGVPVLSGAVLDSFSARLLRFPTISVEPAKPGDPLKLTMLARFPAEPGEPAPRAWTGLFPQAGRGPSSKTP